MLEKEKCKTKFLLSGIKLTVKKWVECLSSCEQTHQQIRIENIDPNIYGNLLYAKGIIEVCKERVAFQYTVL